MKKLIFLLLVMPIIGFAQVTPGKYKLNLASYNLNMELAPSTTIIKVSNDCRDRTSGCGSQVWQIVPFFRMPNVYFLQLVSNGQYLTWNLEEPDKLPTLKPRASNRNINSQAFKIILNDKGSYQIQPYSAETAANDYFLGGETQPGSYGYVRLFKSTQVPRNNNSTITWRFNPPVTPLPVQTAPNVVVTPPPSAQTSSRIVVTPPPPSPIQRTSSVVVSPPSNNKLDIDIRTGGDNLEQRGNQENPEISIEINGQTNIVIPNINKNQTWANNSFHRITVPLPAGVNAADVKSVTINRRTTSATRLELNVSDNWTIASFLVTGYFNNVRTPLANYVSTRPTNKVFRFMANEGNGESGAYNSLYGWGTIVKFDLWLNPTPAPQVTVPVNSNASITAIFGTGGDDLRGGDDNINMQIRFKSGRIPITINNVNARRNWRNFSEVTITKELPNSNNLDINDIKDVIIRHTGGGGYAADNWYLDKFKLTITKGSESRVIIDKIEAPIHFFTGDTRSKTILANP